MRSMTHLTVSGKGITIEGVDELFFTAPLHKMVELETAADYYEYQCDSDEKIIQEMPDTIGTHAVLSADKFHSITLKEVVSWRLLQDGTMDGMLIDEDKVLQHASTAWETVCL